MKIEQSPFLVEWSEETAPLRSEDDLLSRILKIALNIISCVYFEIGLIRIANYAIKLIARRITLPATYRISSKHLLEVNEAFKTFWYGPITEENQTIRAHYSVVNEKVITPDGAELDALCLQHVQQTNTPTIIFFNGNCQLSRETPLSLLEKAIEADIPCNLVLFDYRGIGSSKGIFREPKDLILDGYSIVEWVKRRMKTPGSQIHFYGFSLGGAIASFTKALDTEHLCGKLINDRSFGSSEEMVKLRFGGGFLGSMMNWLFSLQGYKASPAEAFLRCSGDKMVIYHPDDAIIPEEAGLHSKIRHDIILRLEPKVGFEELSKTYHHLAQLYWHQRAVERILEFLFPEKTASLS